MPTSVNISLPDGLSEAVRQRIEAALLEGIESGSVPMDEADWRSIRDEVWQRLKHGEATFADDTSGPLSKSPK